MGQGQEAAVPVELHAAEGADGTSTAVLEPSSGTTSLTSSPTTTTPAPPPDCPPLVAAAPDGAAEGGAVTPDPSCSALGVAELAQTLQKNARLDEQHNRSCAIVASQPGLLRAANGSLISSGRPKLQTIKYGQACIPTPTSPAELDRRDALARQSTVNQDGVQPASGAPGADDGTLGLDATAPQGGSPQLRGGLDSSGDFFSKLQKLTQTLCYFESGASCGVDYNGDSDWYKKYFSVRP
jgi:hypothetical protein